MDSSSPSPSRNKHISNSEINEHEKCLDAFVPSIGSPIIEKQEHLRQVLSQDIRVTGNGSSAPEGYFNSTAAPMSIKSLSNNDPSLDKIKRDGLTIFDHQTVSHLQDDQSQQYSSQVPVIKGESSIIDLKLGRQHPNTISGEQLKSGVVADALKEKSFEDSKTPLIYGAERSRGGISFIGSWVLRNCSSGGGMGSKYEVPDPTGRNLDSESSNNGNEETNRGRQASEQNEGTYDKIFL